MKKQIVCILLTCIFVVSSMAVGVADSHLNTLQSVVEGVDFSVFPEVSWLDWFESTYTGFATFGLPFTEHLELGLVSYVSQGIARVQPVIYLKSVRITLDIVKSSDHSIHVLIGSNRYRLYVESGKWTCVFVGPECARILERIVSANEDVRITCGDSTYLLTKEDIGNLDVFCSYFKQSGILNASWFKDLEGTDIDGGFVILEK